MQYKRRGLAATATLTVLALGAAACGGSDGETASPGASNGEGGLSGSISIVGSEPQNPLVSVNTNETGGGNVLDAITTGLVTYNNETGAPENAVAESIETEDNVTYTIKIKGDQTFHDGTQVKAKNFVDAWNYGAYGPNAALNSYFFETIEGFADVQGEDANGDDLVDESEATATEMSGLAIVDDTTFTVKLSSPASSFPVRLGYTAFVPLPDAFFADPEAFGEKPVGNGPYQLTEWQHDVKLVLDAYEDYTLDDAAAVKTVEYRVYANSDAAYADLLAGNVDIQPTLPTAALAGDQYKSDLGERVVEQAAGTIATITFPPVEVDPRYDNPDLRLALSQSIDREAITKQIFNGSRIPADSFVSPVVDGYKSGNCGVACTFDPEAAKASFEKAGGTFDGTITISYNADGDHKAWTEAACNSIQTTLGTPCEATPVVDFSTFRTAIGAGEVKGLYRTGWQMDYPSIENFLAPLYGTGAGSNDGKYSSEEFDRLITEAASAEGDEANKLYQEAEAVLAKDLPVLPMWFGAVRAGYSENIKSVQFTPFGTPALDTITLN